MNKKTQIHALTFLMVFALFGIGFGFDRFLGFLREANATGRFFGPWYQFSAVSLANLLLAFCVFWLFTRAFPVLDRWALWIIAVLGLVVNFTPILYWLGVGNIILAVFISQRGYFLLAGALTTMAALFTLYRTKKAAA